MGVHVDLPETKASTIKGNDEPLAVSVDKNGKIFIQDSETAVDAVTAKLRAIKETILISVFCAGDAGVNMSDHGGHGSH